MEHQVVRMIMFPETRTAEIILTVCRLGHYITAGRTNQMRLLVSDCENIRTLAENLNLMAESDPYAYVSLWLEGKNYKFDSTLWPGILDCLNDFFSYIDDMDFFFNSDLDIED